MPVEQQVVSVWAGTSGLLDDVPLEDVRRFEEEFLDYLRRDQAGILDAIRETGELSDDTVTSLKDAVEHFRRGFEIRGGEMLVKDEPAEPVDETEVSQEKVKKYVTPPDENKAGDNKAGESKAGENKAGESKAGDNKAGEKK
jgi:F-type H+-transporting ATPase subunit alpha